MTNSLECPNITVLPFEAKAWIEDTFERALFNVVWENEEPVSLIVTVNKDGQFFLSKGKSLVDIQQELESWKNSMSFDSSVDE